MCEKLVGEKQICNSSAYPCFVYCSKKGDKVMALVLFIGDTV